jgi:hypothetical protein
LADTLYSFNNGTTFSNCVGVGYYAGSHETASNKLYIDAIDRVNEADGRTKSLIYGVFNASTTSQELHINAQIINVDDLPVGDVGVASGQLYVDTEANITANADLFVARKV